MAYTDELINGISFRPKIYINLLYSPETITRQDIKNPADLAAKLATFNFTPIGAVQRIEINSTRETQVWRELDFLTAGKPVESFPGLTSYDVTLERVVLYESNMMEVFNFDSFDVMRQNSPLTLKIDMYGTEDRHAKVWYVYGVWFKGNPMRFDITDINDLRIIQTVDAIASGIIEG